MHEETLTPQQPQNGWQTTDQHGVTVAPSSVSVGWTASEYIAHQKNATWFIVLGAVTSVAAGLVYLLSQADIVSTLAVIGVALAFGIFAARPPRSLHYYIDNQGIKVGERMYHYDMFKSFSVMQEGAIRYIWLMPMRRFMLPITIYYDPADEQKIITLLSSFLPHEDRKLDPVDRLMHKVRF